MFFDQKARVFRRLKRLLREVQHAESDMKRRNLEHALKELRRGLQENRKLIKWFREHHSDRIDSSQLAYGADHLDTLFSRATSELMQIREHLNQRNYEDALSRIKEMENYVIWEIRADKRYTRHNREVMQSAQEEQKKLIQDVDRELVRVIEHYGIADPVDFINIANKEQEKKRFLSAFRGGSVYEPQFSYKGLSERVLAKAEKEGEDAMARLRQLKVPTTTGAGYLVEKKRRNLQILLKLIRNIGTDKVTKYSMQLYGFPSNELIREAYQAMEEGKKEVEKKLDSKLDVERYSAKEFKKKADAFFRENGMDWETVLKPDSEMTGRFKTDNTRRQLYINQDEAPFSEKDIIKAIEHEIKVHAYRMEAGRKSPLQILAYGTSGYLPTEEGLTTYFEDLKDATNPLLQKKKYLYTITIYNAYKGGFYSCFSHLVSHGIEPELAWEVVVRVKRGLRDTSRRGGFFKDHVTFLGDKLVRQFVASGGQPEDLLGGKIGLNDVKHLVEGYRL